MSRQVARVETLFLHERGDEYLVVAQRDGERLFRGVVELTETDAGPRPRQLRIKTGSDEEPRPPEEFVEIARRAERIRISQQTSGRARSELKEMLSGYQLEATAVRTCRLCANQWRYTPITTETAVKSGSEYICRECATRELERELSFSGGFSAAAEQRLAWIRELDAVLEEGRVVPIYQPVVDLTSGRTAGFEALLRVRGADGALHPPMDYIALAEEVGATGAFARQMLDQACHDAASWGEGGPFVAVNVSQRDLEGESLLEDVAEALRRSGLSPTRLELEVTESALASDFEAARRYLERFRDMGVAVTIDDFGTGYASLSALAALPVSKLKVDKTFVWSYGEDATATAIVDAVLGLARSLSVRTTAEGIETAEQLDALRRLGCDSAQGFLFAKGGLAPEVAEMVGQVWFDRG